MKWQAISCIRVTGNLIHYASRPYHWRGNALFLLRNACVFLFLSALVNQTPTPQTTNPPNDQTTNFLLSEAVFN